MYVNDIGKAKPVGWMPKIYYCAPDCGGEECDEIDYVPICPVCKNELDNSFRDNFCRKCGAKLWWKVREPEILMDGGIEEKANTNGGKIRRMADEELAVYFWKKRDSFFRMTILQWYNWLKEEADGYVY